MTSETNSTFGKARPHDAESLFGQIEDYVEVGLRLFWQRQMIFAAALCLQAFYYSLELALLTTAMVGISEAFDYRVFKSISKVQTPTKAIVRKWLRQIQFGTILSAGIISFFAHSIATYQGIGNHFMPLFFLFAATLFSAMNNHQILSVLILRMTIYGITFLFIPIRDIWLSGASIESELWVQLFTSVFVLYFIIDCSRIYLGFYQDNRSQLEKLQKEHEITKVALNAKSEFLATISHELRTPLTSIKGSLDLISSGALSTSSESYQRVLNIAQRNSERLNALINELLDLQRMESGKMTYEFLPVDVTHLLSQSISSTQPFADAFDVTIKMGEIEDVVCVLADEKRLEQVVANFLSNAAKFSHRGGEVEVLLKVTPDTVRIEVVDRGVGLEESQSDKVFDRFSQLDSSDQRKVGGTGLGMNISKIIVDAHGGEIGYSRNETVGTTFFVELERLNKK